MSKFMTKIPVSKLTKTGLATLGIACLYFATAQDAAKQPANTPIHQWKPVAALNSARSEACAAALPNGRMVVAGGSNADGVLTSVEITNESGAFAPASPMQNPRANHACVALADGTMLVAGGR